MLPRPRGDCESQIQTPDSLARQCSKSFLTAGAGMLTVLLVDDDALILSAASMMLRQWGHHSLCATSLPECIQRIDEHGGEIHFVLLDQNLRNGVTGSGIAQAIWDHLGYRPATALVTGEVSAALTERAKMLGVQLLHKPFNPERLRRLLEPGSSRTD